MNKFENVDVIASLRAVMHLNTVHYQSDFEIDQDIIRRMAASAAAEDKTLLWLSRPSGTHCFRERDAFIKDTYEYNTWKFYGEQTHDSILAYAVALTGAENGTMRGNLYELEYPAHFQHVKDRALPAITNKLFFENGIREIPAFHHFDALPDPEFGKFMRYEAQPADPDALRYTLQYEQRSHERLAPGDFKEHIAVLRGGVVEAEARRIASEMRALKEPNSPSGTHFMVELSQQFRMIADSRDTDRLFAMLPYKSLSLSTLKDRRGTFAFVNKDENRDKDIRRPRLSVRKQLAADKERITPKSAAAKTKTNDLEV